LQESALRTNFREMRKQGLRPFAVGAIGEVVIAVFTLSVVAGARKALRASSAKEKGRSRRPSSQ